MSMSIVFLVVLSSFVGMFAAIAPASAAAGDLTISGPFTIQNEVYYVDGNVLVTSTGTLTIRDAELRIMSDALNMHSITIDGGKLILDGGTITTFLDTVHSWPLLTLTFQNGATVTATNGSMLKFPGSLVSTGSITKVTLTDTNITKLDSLAALNTAVMPATSCDNGPTISIADSTWELYDSKIWNLPEGPDRGDLTLSGAAQFTAVNSFISVDFENWTTSPTTKNAFKISDHANAYLYGCSFASSTAPYGDSAFNATTINSNDAGAPANPVPATKYGWDNATGAPPIANLWNENDGSNYIVNAQKNMAVFNFNTTAVSSDLLAATLVVKYSTGATYAGTRAVNYTTGGVTKPLSIVPAASQNTRIEVDMLSLGIDTIAKANGLLISFFNSGTVGAGDIQFDAVYLKVIVGPQAYIYRMGDITVDDMYGVPLSGATVAAKFNSSTWLGGKDVYYYTPPTAAMANDPPASILAYLGKTVGNYKITDSKGKVLVPYLTDIISGVSKPNSLFVGSLNVTATSGVSTSAPVSLTPYPQMQPENATTSASIMIDGALAPTWDTSKFLIVPPSLTISDGAYTHNGDIICRTGGTLTLRNEMPFMISRGADETTKVLIANGGTLRIIDTVFDSNRPVSIEVRTGGTLMIDGSQISSDVTINVVGNAAVQITGGSSIQGSLIVSSGVAATLDIRDSNFSAAPVVAGTSVVTLSNVSAPSISILDNAKVYLYRWATAIVQDEDDLPIQGANVTACFQANGTLYTKQVTGSDGRAALKLIACTMFATNSVVTTTYYGNYRINATYNYALVTYLSDNQNISLDSYTEPLAVNNPSDLPLSIVIGLPDLSAGSLFINPDPAFEGSTDTNVFLTITNIGNTDATPAFSVYYYYDVMDVGHQIGIDVISTLGAKATTLSSVPWPTPPNGPHTLYASINPAHTVIEKSYINNLATASATVLSMPDLYISNIYAELNNAPVTGNVPSSSQVTIRVLVHNAGQTPVSTPVTIALYNATPFTASTRIAYQNTSLGQSIPQAGTLNISFDYMLDAISVPTTHITIWAMVNPQVSQGGFAATQISESDDPGRANNSDSFVLGVFDSRPDPMVTTDDISVFLNLTEEIRTHGNDVSYANSLTIEVTVTNDGYLPASHVSVSVNFTGMGEDIPISVQYVDLNGSQSKKVTFTYIVAVRYSGPYHVNVTLDFEQSVNDKNRTNNVASRALNVSYIQPTITVFAPAGKSRNITVGQQLLFVNGNVKYPDGQPMKNITVTVVLQTLTGVNISGTIMIVHTTEDLGTFSANVPIPADLAKGDYKLVITVGKNSVEVLISVSPPSSGLDAWMLIIIIAAIGVGVLIFSLYIYKQGVGKLVECGECGALIPESAKKCPKCGVEFEEDMVKCSECGAWIAASSVECPNCHVRFGTPLEGEKTYEGKMKDQYEETVLSKYREFAKGDLGKKYTEESFQEWWMANPAFISFEDWLAKEEERRTQANLITCAVCGTPNVKGSTVCRNCGSPLPAEGAAAAGATAEGAIIEKRVIRMPIDRKIVPKKVIKKPLDQEQQQGGQQQQ